MSPLLPRQWYRHHAILMALAINERLLERDGAFDPVWAGVLFTSLLGIDVRGERGQRLAIDPFAFPTSVRARLALFARSTSIEPWAGARFKGNAGSGASRTAKLIASLLHRRDVPPRTLWRIARDELSGTAMPEAENLEEPLSELSSSLRSHKSRRAKLRAITRFSEAVPSLAISWPALEPALVQPLLDWVPAVVGEAGSMLRPGVMVPLMVDLHRRLGADSVSIVGTLQETAALERSAQLALHGACALWRDRYSNAPARRRLEVLDAKVRVDLQLVEGIAQACAHARSDSIPLDARLDLGGRSLELPLALAIYDRLVGSRTHGEFRASGTLRRYRPDAVQDPRSGETDLGDVTGETAKALAAEAQLADRFILAQGSERPTTTVPIVFAATLGAAVDQAFGDSGDGHRFIRAPDLAAGFKGNKFSIGHVELFKNRLRAGLAVVETDEPLALVVQALFDVNKRLGPERYQSRGRYTFVRLSPTERADAAWATIWSAVDGDMKEFAEFATAWSFRKRAELVARQMSRNASSMSDPRWSPHVLVLAGVPPAENKPGLKGGAGRFDIRRIMADVEAILSEAPSPCDACLRARIGATRVILVEDDGMAGFDAPAPQLEPDLEDALERLSAFRYGFSFDMARRQLGNADEPMSADRCESTLRRLQAVSCEDEQPLLVVGTSNIWRRRSAPTAFAYMLRRRRLPLALPRRITIHERAAHSIAPILHPARTDAHLDLAECLGASWLDEAYFQLSAAREIAVKQRHVSRKAELSRLRLRLLRLSGWFILERLPAMMGRTGNEAVYEDFADRLSPTDHPALHARAASFATILASRASVPAERRRLYQEALRHLNDGARACGRLDDPEEREGATFLIATERCRLAYVGRNEPDEVLEPAYRSLRSYAPLALDHLRNMREIYWFDWFARVGSLIDDKVMANAVYRAGLWNEALPGSPNAGDETLIGWAGTLDPVRPVDPVLLSYVRAHLLNGFFQRREIAEREALKAGECPTPRARAGMARLHKIAQAARAMA